MKSIIGCAADRPCATLVMMVIGGRMSSLFERLMRVCLAMMVLVVLWVCAGYCCCCWMLMMVVVVSFVWSEWQSVLEGRVSCRAIVVEWTRLSDVFVRVSMIHGHQSRLFWVSRWFLGGGGEEEGGGGGVETERPDLCIWV